MSNIESRSSVLEEFERQVLQGFDKAARHTLGFHLQSIKKGVDDCDLGRILPVIEDQMDRLCKRYGIELKEEQS